MSYQVQSLFDLTQSFALLTVIQAHPWFDSIFSVMSVLSIGLLWLPSAVVANKWLGVKKAIGLFGALGIFALGFESIAVITGWPYGVFYYSADLGYRVFDLVPWTVALAWSPLVVASMTIAHYCTGKWWKKIILSASVLVCIDLVLDPGAVASGFWVWEYPVGWYGIPLSNFAGWFVSGVLGSALFSVLTSSGNHSITPPPRGLLISAWISLFLWTGVCLFFYLYGAFLIGVVLLLIFSFFFFRYIPSRKVLPDYVI